MVVFAHGAAGLSSLPLPRWILTYLVVMCVAIAWAVLRRRPDPVGLTLPAGLERADAVAGVVVRVLAVATIAAVIVSAWFGDAGRTSTPTIAAYIVGWVGLPLGAAVVGNLTTPPERLAPTFWPAAAATLVLSWVELASHDPSAPEPIGVLAVGLAIGLALGARRWAPGWLRLVTAIAPLHRSGGRLRIRAVGAGLVAVDRRAGMRALLAVVVGSVAFDVVQRTTTRLDTTLLRTLGLVGCVTVAGVVMRVVDDPAALVPVALSWVLGLYLSLLLIEGQTVIAAASDPLGRGWDLFGTADHNVRFGLVSDTTITWLQVACIGGGHAVGVVVARDRRTVVALAALAAVAAVMLVGR